MKARYSLLNGWRNTCRRLPMKNLRYLALFVGFAGVANCDDCDGTPPEDTTAPQSLSVDVSPTLQQIAQGSSTTFNLTVQRIGVSGAVSLSTVDGSLPTGVTVSYAPSTLPAGVSTAVATVTVAPNAPLTFISGTTTEPTFIQVQATGGGVQGKGAMGIQLKLSSAAGVTTTITPASFSLNLGESRDATVRVARQGNYTGNVSTSVVLPAVALSGVTVTLAPVTGTPDSYNLHVAVASNAAFGNMTVSVRAAPDGLNAALSDVSITVVKPSFGPHVLRELRLRAGESDTVTILLGRSPGFSAPITMALENAPTGVTGTFSPNPAVDDATLLTVRATAAVPTGVYTLQVRGTPAVSSGAADQTVQVKANVDAPLATGSYTIGAPNISLTAGNSATGTFSINRSGGFAGAVTVALQRSGGVPVPTGLSIVLDQNPVTGATTTMRVVTTAATPEGTYAFVATGTSPNSSNVTANFNVVVIAAPRATSLTIGKLVNGLPIATTSETLGFGGTVTLIPVVLDQNGQPMTSESVTWSSANTGIASVTNAGVVTAVSSGTTTVTATSVSNSAVKATVSITVQAAPTSVVARVELEPGNAEITAPATQQYLVAIFNAAGARTTGDAGASFEYSSSNPAVATINATSGVATGVSAGTTTITVKYLVNGQLVKQDASTLTVYAAGSVGHYGSVTISTGNNTRNARVGQATLFQIFVRDVAGNVRTSGVTPAPVVTSSNTSLATITPSSGPDGYFYTLNVSATAAVGATFKIRYDVMGAGGEVTMTIVP